MSNARKSVSLFMLLVFLLVFFTAASANSFIDTEEMIITPNVNPYEYGTSPDDLYVFLYRGYEPYLTIDIDTSGCIESRLYVFDAEINSVTEIFSQPVSLYTCTQDALFFVTTAQSVYKADYAGQNIEFLYQSVRGDISDLNSYLDTLYFIEDNSHITILNYNTGTPQTVWNCADLSWSFRLSPTELVAATVDEEHYLLDIATGTASEIGNMTANGLITAAVTSADAASEANESGMSLMAYFSPSSIQQENDVPLPLPEYPVTYGNTPNFQNGVYTDPISWFHKDGKEGCDGESNCKEYTETSECEGFARFAHDRYLHNVAPDETDYDAWFATYPRNGRRELNNVEVIEDFFADLNTGDYVRYGNYEDSTPSNGMHSIVFVSMDAGGIWAYECNQKYYDDLSADRKDDHDADDFGCGIHLQYYTFSNIKARYNYVLYYITHNYSREDTYYSPAYHSVGCSHCVGYLLQKHDVVSATIVSTSQHYATFNCCGGNTATTLHTGTTLKSYYSKASHKVTATCCSGYVLANHTFQMDFSNRSVCTGCGYVKGALIVAGI